MLLYLAGLHKALTVVCDEYVDAAFHKDLRGHSHLVHPNKGCGSFKKKLAINFCN